MSREAFEKWYLDFCERMNETPRLQMENSNGGDCYYTDRKVMTAYASWQAATKAAEGKCIVDAVRGADKATVFDDNSIYHDDDCDPKHYGRVLIIPASVLEGE